MSIENTPNVNSAVEKVKIAPGLRLLAIFLALIALGGSQWVAIFGLDCDECKKASLLVADLPLAWMGVVFYGVLTLLASTGGMSRWTRAGFIFAGGLHLVLMILLWKEKLFCGGCVTAGSAALLGCFACLIARPRPGKWGIVLLILACVGTLGGLVTARQMQKRQIEALLKEHRNETQPTTIPTGRVRMVVYERPGCRYCLEFEERYMPRLKADFGDTLEVIRLDAPPAMSTPSFELSGNNGQKFLEGPQVYDVLVKDIREVR